MSLSKAELKLKKNFLLLDIVVKLLMYKFFKYLSEHEIFRISGTTPCCKNWLNI